MMWLIIVKNALKINQDIVGMFYFKIELANAEEAISIHMRSKKHYSIGLIPRCRN